MLFLSDFFYKNALINEIFYLILRVQIIDYKWVMPHFSQLRGVIHWYSATYVRVMRVYVRVNKNSADVPQVN
jgi:hypothetical protein